ncbi:MAG TPA: tyrosine-protein phosphatase [Pseudomonadales bacterium]
MNRILDVPGAINLRDFGGYETVDGGRVRRSLLYRSGMLAELTRDGQRALRELGIGVICDLRRDDERELEPTPFPAHDPRQVVVSIDPDKAVKARLGVEYSGLEVAERVRYMIEINIDLARLHMQEYRRVFDALWSAGDSGFLIHCAAGKDRTGFGVAAIQLALGVPRETVVEDYLLTNVAMDFERYIVPRLRKHYAEVDVERARALSGARAEYINAALDALDAEYGSFDAYLERGLGLDAGRRAALRARYLE